MTRTTKLGIDIDFQSLDQEGILTDVQYENYILPQTNGKSLRV